MSWTVSARGEREDVKAQAAAMFDSAAKNYAGSEEEKDILMAKERALSIVDTIDLTAAMPEGESCEVSVHCYGSRTTFDGRVGGMTTYINVERVGRQK